MLVPKKTMCEGKVMDILHMAKCGMKSQGKRLMLKHLNNERLSASQAIKAKCFDCCGGFADGRQPCKISSCPLIKWYPFNATAKSKATERIQLTE
jgi:hypothetical protein